MQEAGESVSRGKLRPFLSEIARIVLLWPLFRPHPPSFTVVSASSVFLPEVGFGRRDLSTAGRESTNEAAHTLGFSFNLPGNLNHPYGVLDIFSLARVAAS